MPKRPSQAVQWGPRKMWGSGYNYTWGRVRKPGNGYTRKAGFYKRYTRRTAMSRIARGLNIEKKFFDTTLSFLFDATGEVPATGQLTLIPQGTTESTRVGRKAQVKSIQLRGTVEYVPGSDTLGNTDVFLVLVQDRQANGAAATATDVFTSANFGVGMINMANSERFKILARWDIHLQAGAGVSAAYGRDSKFINFYKKLNLPVEYSSTTGAIGEIKSNNLFLLAGTNNTTDDQVTMTGSCRLRYTDL